MHPAYFETRFRTTTSSSDWPPSFVIISACATTGETWPRQANEEADNRLAAELNARGVWTTRVTGYSPLTGHAEPGWAVEVDLQDARDIGRRFLQDAIYIVETDVLWVVSCAGDDPPVEVGTFSSRLEAPPSPQS